MLNHQSIIHFGVKNRNFKILSGVCNSIGRASLGALANIPCINVLHVHNICLIIAGAVTILAMFVEASFLSLAIYVAIWGYFIGKIFKNQAVHVSLHKL